LLWNVVSVVKSVWTKESRAEEIGKQSRGKKKRGGRDGTGREEGSLILSSSSLLTFHPDQSVPFQEIFSPKPLRTNQLFHIRSQKRERKRSRGGEGGGEEIISIR
jgi:hypothetical protein